jgi:hypothetical protein
MAISTSRRLAGIAFITIDGVSFDVKGELNWSPSSIKRETLIGQSGIAGYSEMPIAGYISATLFDNSGLSVADFNDMTDTTVQILQANGKQIIGTGMWSVEANEVKSEPGEFNVKFESDDVTEIGA